MIKHTRTWLLFRWSASPPPEGAGSQHSSVLGIHFCLCIHPLTQSDQISDGNTWTGLVFTRPATLAPKGNGVTALPNLVFLSINVNTLCRRITEFDVGTHTRKGLVLGVSDAPPQGGRSQRCQFLVFPSTYAYTLCRRDTKFDVVTHVKVTYVKRVSWVGHSSHHKRAAFQRSSKVRVLLYLFI